MRWSKRDCLVPSSESNNALMSLNLLRSWIQLRKPSSYRTVATQQTNPTRSQNVVVRRALVFAGGVSVGALCYWTWDRVRDEEPRILALHSFAPSQLISSEQVTEDTKLLQFAFSKECVKNLDRPKAIWSLYVKDSDIQVERPYTPLEGISSSGEIQFWVKRYRYGEVGRWLHSRMVGETIEMRGPEQTWLWEEGRWDKVVMVFSQCS